MREILWFVRHMHICAKVGDTISEVLEQPRTIFNRCDMPNRLPSSYHAGRGTGGNSYPYSLEAYAYLRYRCRWHSEHRTTRFTQKLAGGGQSFHIRNQWSHGRA